MNQAQTPRFPHMRPLALAIAGTLLVSACASAPKLSDGAMSARAHLTQLQADPQLAPRAQVAIREAEQAVVAAESSRKKDAETRAHLDYMAGHKVDLAQSLAQQRLLEDQRKALSEQREAARLDARTREADGARRDATAARNDALVARSDAALANDAAASARNAAAAARDDARDARNRTEAANLEADAANRKAQDASNATDAAQAATASANQAAAELQRQIAELNARETDRGLVVTLGDVLFSTGKSDLRGAAAGHLDKLAAFLARYGDRTVTVEGHTDSVGSDAANLSLSQRRADAVKGYLVAHGIANGRLTAAGMGEGSPVSDNATATGRQQNRRVEVVIANPLAGAR